MNLTLNGRGPEWLAENCHPPQPWEKHVYEMGLSSGDNPRRLGGGSLNGEYGTPIW